jgi:RND family efflux transporter MFP subunit
MNRFLNIALVCLIVGGLTAAVAFKLKSNQHQVEEAVYRPDSARPIQVQTAAVERRTLAVTTRYVGEFAPAREVTISAETPGTLRSLPVKEGDFVHADQVLGQLDTELMQAQLAAAQASYDGARRSLGRYRSAATGTGVSEAQLDNADTQLRTAEAQLRQLRKQVAQGTIRAPFAGFINVRHAEVGAVLGAGSPVVELIDMKELRLVLAVPETELASFRIGAPVNVTVDALSNRVVPGTVAFVAAKADAAHKYTVKIKVINPSDAPLRAGMYATVTRTDSAMALVIPRAALLGSAEAPTVYVLGAGGVVRLTNIRTGRITDQLVAVHEGLSAGEAVVTNGQINLTDGARVAE